jgi:hypothetical protein
MGRSVKVVTLRISEALALLAPRSAPSSPWHRLRLRGEVKMQPIAIAQPTAKISCAPAYRSG